MEPIGFFVLLLAVVEREQNRQNLVRLMAEVDEPTPSALDV